MTTLSAMKVILCLALGSAGTLAAEPTLTIDASKSAGPVSPMLYGLMTEEINHSYDGGLYAELLQNRAFMDDSKTPAHWSVIGDPSTTMRLDPSQPLSEAIKTSLRVEVKASSGGVANEGYWGIPITPNTDYRASFYAKGAAGFSGKVIVALQTADGATQFASAEPQEISGDWKRYEVILHTADDLQPTSKARLALTLDRPGQFWLGLVSLFPPTWNNQPNGFRKDLMQMMVDLHPKFLRMPGGNYVEGNTFEERFDWKKTVGKLIDRPGHLSPWGYRSTDGLGLLEFCQWCEDMKAEPVLAVFAGYVLRGEHVDAGPKLEPFVQDALDEIEYVSGDATTTWGKRRADDGHLTPFPLHYVEIGNEDFFDKSKSYDGRFGQFFDAIKKKYPQLKIISSVGNEQQKAMVTGRVPDVVDEHYYRPAAEFISASPDYYEKYDHGPRPEIFVGEWASYEDAAIKPWTPPAKKLPVTPAFKAALGDGCWLAAMERNGDLVKMSCYAPMFVNVNTGAWQWRPDLIGYDASRVFGSPSYYAIKMFSTNVGDERLAITFADSPVQGSATRDSKSGKIYLKLVNPTATDVPLSIDLKGVSAIAATAAVSTMSADPEAQNSIDEPTKVVPKDSTIAEVKPTFTWTVPANSINAITLDR